jgi:hypothetical protein
MVSKLIIPNLYKKFKLKKRNIIFENYIQRPIILKEGISNGILEVFEFLE